MRNGMHVTSSLKRNSEIETCRNDILSRYVFSFIIITREKEFDMENAGINQMIAKQWERYRLAGWKGRLDLLRHRISMYIGHADEIYEYLNMVLDDHTELKYSVNKAAVLNDDHSMKGFVRFVFALKEGETKTFEWVTSNGIKEWILSRDPAALYVIVPEFKEGFFIRYRDFRDECLSAYEKCYGWGYNADICRIEVPAADYDFLKTLDVQDEFELVRFLDDGQSFETTDADRLLQYINEYRSAEVVSDDPDHDRIRQFHSLYEAIKHYVDKQERLRRTKKLRPATGISLSWRKDNWEECDFRYNVSMDPNDWHEAVYRRYGDLPDGRHFGVYIWPKSEVWPEVSAMMIVSEDGEMQVNTIIDDRWDAQEADRWPLAAAASPSGKTIVWLKDNRIWVWHEDKRDKRFLPDDGDYLTDRIGCLPVLDAIMRKDGILVLDLEGSERSYAYLCDEDIVLVRYEDCWIPADKAEAPCWNAVMQDHVDYWPDSFAVMVCEEDDEYDYYSCGVRRVCFEPGLEIIKPGMLADNPNLESVTIPASVKEVCTWAFGSCTNLKNLVIEGEPSRVANWAENAFEGCACEEIYLRLRSTGR